MKKLLLIVFLSIFVISSFSFAALKYSFGGAFSTNSFTTQPTLVINIDDKYDVIVGYQSITNGSGNDANTSTLLGGTIYMFKTGNVSCGWSAYYLAAAFPNGGSASDNNLTSINIGFTAKTQLVQGVQIRGDAVLLSSVSGKVAAVESGGTSICPSLQLSILFDIM